MDKTQIRDNEEDNEYWFRHISKGGWPFSTAAHGWPIADCTAEGKEGASQVHTLTPWGGSGGGPQLPGQVHVSFYTFSSESDAQNRLSTTALGHGLMILPSPPTQA